MGAVNFSRNPYTSITLKNNQKNSEALREIEELINDSDLFWLSVKVEYGYHEDIRLQIDLGSIPVWVDDEETPDGYGQVWGRDSDWEICGPLQEKEFDDELSRQIKEIELCLEIARLKF